jgi:glycosyltransferase involved in cell wall biosynthesis
MHHLGGIVPAWRPTPTILTIHDLQPLAMPRHFRFDKRAFNGFAVPRSVRAARDVVTLTEFTKRDLHERLQVSPERVTVVPPGFDQPAPGVSEDDRARVRRVYGIGDRPYFLFPAITYPHKNHLMLLRAFARVVETHPETVLILTGGEAHKEEEVRIMARTLGIADRVTRTGRIPAADIDVLYREAAALTFPSLYEGFGLPVLEAMSRGCPVIAANATALPEVVRDAGLVLPPSDPEEWSAAMISVLEDDDLRSRLVRLGHERARHYDWTFSAERLADVYRHAPMQRGGDR